MKPEFFKNLPPEIITEILLRLPVVSIPMSKCVCKRWLHLLESDSFVKSHFARSAPALVVLGDSGRLKVFELEGELDLHLHLDPLTQYDFPYRSRINHIYSYVNGLFVLRMRLDVVRRVGVNMFCVCNPITREVIKLDLPSESMSAYGFGASKITGRYKAVYIKYNSDDDKLYCHVYTLGTGSWRRLEGIPSVNQFGPQTYYHGRGAFLNGNLHWMATAKASWISCFDVETECFSFFKAPPYHAQGLPFIRRTPIYTLNGCLYYCEETSEYDYEGDEDDEVGTGRHEVTIWIMKEYGVDESWSKEYVIPLDDGLRYPNPIKAFENGDLLMLVVHGSTHLFFYDSNKNKTMQRIDLFGAGETYDNVECGLFTPTLVSLKTLGLGVENVISF